MIWVIISLIASWIMVVLAGRSDGRQTIKKDLQLKDNLIYEKLMREHPEWEEWYLGVGGVNRWNPALPSIPSLNFWYGDFWHTEKHKWIICFSIAIAIQVLTVFSLLFNIWIGLLVGSVSAFIFAITEGFSFRAFYGHIYRRGAEKWTVIFKDINPFKNSHKEKD